MRGRSTACYSGWFHSLDALIYMSITHPSRCTRRLFPLPNLVIAVRGQMSVVAPASDCRPSKQNPANNASLDCFLTRISSGFVSPTRQEGHAALTRRSVPGMSELKPVRFRYCVDSNVGPPAKLLCESYHYCKPHTQTRLVGVWGKASVQTVMMDSEANP